MEDTLPTKKGFDPLQRVPITKGLDPPSNKQKNCHVGGHPKNEGSRLGSSPSNRTKTCMPSGPSI